MTDIKTALHDLLNEQSIPLDVAIDRHFGPDYRQRTNGEWDDRAGFAAHIAHLRSLVRSARIDVLDEITVGHRYADRHVVDIRKCDGRRVVQEVYLFGEFDEDGRFGRVEETTLLLTGSEADRALGNAK